MTHNYWEKKRIICARINKSHVSNRKTEEKKMPNPKSRQKRLPPINGLSRRRIIIYFIRVTDPKSLVIQYLRNSVRT